jgi:DNA-binding transcriptional MerR regulator
MASIHRPVIVGVVTTLAALSLAGCSEERQVQSKKERLYSAENIQLKKQIQGLESQGSELQQQLDGCSKNKQYLQDQLRKGFGEELTNVLTIFDARYSELIEENSRLKARIEKLEGSQQSQ